MSNSTTYSSECLEFGNHDDDDHYPCEDCDRSFNTKKGLLLHIRKIHRGKRNKFDETLFNGTEIEIPQGDFECGEANCDHATNREDLLGVHLRIRHGKVLTFQCRLCEYEARTRPDIRKHLLEDHKQIK